MDTSSVAWIFAVTFITSARAAVSDDPEIAANSVNVSFYMLTTSEWDEKQDTFKDTVVDIMSDFCEDNPSACGLTGWTTGHKFSSDGVQITSAKQHSHEFNITCAVLFNANVPAQNKTLTDAAVSKAALTAALVRYRVDLKEAMDHSILAVGKEAYTPDPPLIMNIIFGTIGGGVLLFLIILTVALYKWRKGEDRKEAMLIDIARQRQMKAERHTREKEGSGGSSLPPHRVGPSPDNAPPGDPATSNPGAKDIESGTPDFRSGPTEPMDNHPDSAKKTSTFSFRAAQYSVSRASSNDDSSHGNQTEDTIVSMHESQGQGRQSKHKRQSKSRHSSKYEESDVDKGGDIGHYGKPYGEPQAVVNISTVSASTKGSDSDTNLNAGVNPSGVTTDL